MANWSDPRPRAYAQTEVHSAAFDAGLRAHMLSVYNYMTSAVLLTGLIAMAFSWGYENSYAAQVLYGGGPLAWIIMLSPLAIVFAMSFGQNRMSMTTLQALYWSFAVLMGLSLSTVFLRYTGESIATAFFATAASFAGLSLWGYTTKRSLSGFGTFLIMGLVGIIVASVVNLFLQSGPLSLILAAAGVLVFAGLTAFHTQRIKSLYAYVAGTEMAGRAAIMGALQLYLDFINMFLSLLRLFGSARN